MTKLSNAKLKRIFDDIAPKYDKASNNYTTTRRREILVGWAKGKCLEVGAGTGETSKALMKNGHKVIASDISAKMVKEIRKKGIKAVTCDAEKLPFKNKSFDTIIASEVIYYLDNPSRLILEAHRVLKPNGQLLISSANDDVRYYDQVRTCLRKLGIGKMYFDDPIHNFLSLTKLKKLLNKGGFKNVNRQKIIIFPFQLFDKLNKILEKTPLNYFGVFILVRARKR